MAASTQSHIANKMTADEAAKISAEKTRIELEKLQHSIKNTNAFEKNNMKTPSDIESSCSSDGSESDIEVSSHPMRKPKQYKHMSMEDRMYNDNQKLWKKNQELKLELERTGKQLRYLQFEHNNKCLEISNLNGKMIQFNTMKSACFYARLNAFMCYLIVMAMMVQFVFEYPVIDIVAKHTKEITTHYACIARKKINETIGEYIKE